MVNQIPKEERKRLLAKIHIGKNQLGLSDEDYRHILEEVTGLRSCRTMNLTQLTLVLNTFKDMGFKVKFEPEGKGKLRKTVQNKIRALWLELHRIGAVQDERDKAMNAWVERQVGVSRIEWLLPKQAQTIIESQKQWFNRVSPDEKK
jgi:phage gp16-like protein